MLFLERLSCLIFGIERKVLGDIYFIWYLLRFNFFILSDLMGFKKVVLIFIKVFFDRIKFVVVIGS